MNAKSKFDTEDVDVKRHGQYMRGGCGAPYNLAAGPGRLDVSTLHPPKFIKMIFQALGWKTEPDKCPDS